MTLKLAQVVYLTGGVLYALVALWAFAIGLKNGLGMADIQVLFVGALGLIYAILISALIGKYRHKKKR
jgi:sterol desaturase/sphingolipid hydroxylase (fatty acid hydroxylase superfamily)